MEGLQSGIALPSSTGVYRVIHRGPDSMEIEGWLVIPGGRVSAVPVLRALVGYADVSPSFLEIDTPESYLYESCKLYGQAAESWLMSRLSQLGWHECSGVDTARAQPSVRTAAVAGHLRRVIPKECSSLSFIVASPCGAVHVEPGCRRRLD